MVAKTVKHDFLQEIWNGFKKTQTTKEIYNEILTETESNESLPGVWCPSVVT